MKVNQNYFNLEDSYLFSNIAKKVSAYQVAHPKEEILHLGIGDVSLPLVPTVIEAMHMAVNDMANMDTFHGYGEEQGYLFLREAICSYYEKKHVSLEASELFINDGAKSDLGNILDIFDVDNSVLIPDPVYPVYVDSNIMVGRKIHYLDATQENGFLPMPNAQQSADLIYLCSPNNPTGAHYTKAQLQEWVDYAIQQDAVILFDSAYESFVQDSSLPTSIYEIEQAKQCAIEFCSLSKTAGFTGTRCGYTVIPHALIRQGVSLHQLWLRRQTTKFNGVSYIVQKGAQAVFSTKGQQEVKQQIAYYVENVRILSDAFRSLGFHVPTTTNSPYLWLPTPHKISSWEFFDELLTECQIVCTPGVGFGSNGEGYVRFSSFAKREEVEKAKERLLRCYKNAK